MLNRLSKTFRLVPYLLPLITVPKPYFPFSAGKTHQDLTLKFVVDAITDSQRRKFLQRQVLNKAKLIVPATIRKPDETVIGLKKQGKCVGVIRGHDGEEDIDVVMPGAIFKNLIRKVSKAVGTCYVRIEGKEIHCAIQDIKVHAEMFVQKVYLSKLVSGKPTQVTVPIIMTHFTTNPNAQKGSQIVQKHDQVTLITYNVDYPTAIALDISYVTPQRPYRFADLANTFPPGLQLSPKHKPMDKIFILHEAPDVDVDEILENYEAAKEKMAAQKEAAKKAAAAKGATGKPGEAAKPAAGGGQKK